MQRIKFLLTFLLLTYFSGFSQSNILSEQASVSVITCGLGNEMYSLFGHTAIRINDPEKAIDVVYNYGAFDFDTPNFVLRFSKGDLQYFVTAGTFYDFRQQYISDHRSVVEQVLNISLQQKQELFDHLNETLISESRFYTYKFIDRNCTTMVVDVLNKVLGKTVIVKVESTDKTYREILYPYFKNHFYEQLGTSIIFGKKVDLKGTSVFLPFELQRSLDVVAYNGSKLSTAKNQIVQVEPELPFSWWDNVFTYLIILILLLLANTRSLNIFYFLIVGLIGLFFSVAGFYSFHRELEYNYNVLLFNPAILFLIGFMIRRNAMWIVWTSIFLLLCLGIYVVVMLDKVHLVIVSPLIVVNLILYIRLILKHKPRKEVIA